MAEAFNLLNEKWIPVIRGDGSTDRLGILGVFRQAHRIRQFGASNPMDRIALFRFFLALLYWCKGNPSETCLAEAEDSFPPAWFAKIEENHECFDLLGQERRFYQDPRADREKPVTELLQEIPSGHNFEHFRHVADYEVGLCASCCAMGLLRLPLFCLSGLPDLRSGINGTPPVYVVRWAGSLLDSLVANWIRREPHGTPAWLNPSVKPDPGREVPVLVGLTLLARRVWLHEPSQRAGICFRCGARGVKLISKCFYESAGKQKNSYWRDPHVLYLGASDSRTIRATDLTGAGKLLEDKRAPGLLSRILESDHLRKQGRIEGLLIVGFASRQALNVDVWERLIPITSASEEATGVVRRWDKQFRDVIKKMHPTDERKKHREHPEIRAVVQALWPHMRSKGHPLWPGIISGNQQAVSAYAREIEFLKCVAAGPLSPGGYLEAAARRREILRLQLEIAPGQRDRQVLRRRKEEKSVRE